MDKQTYFGLLVLLLINFICLFAITFSLESYLLELFVAVILLIAGCGLAYSFYNGKRYTSRFAILFFAANLINIAFLFTAIPSSLLYQGLIILVINIIGFSYSVNAAARKVLPKSKPVELPREISYKEPEPLSYKQFTKPAARVVKPAKKKTTNKKKAAKRRVKKKASKKKAAKKKR